MYIKIIGSIFLLSKLYTLDKIIDSFFIFLKLDIKRIYYYNNDYSICYINLRLIFLVIDISYVR